MQSGQEEDKPRDPAQTMDSPQHKALGCASMEWGDGRKREAEQLKQMEGQIWGCEVGEEQPGKPPKAMVNLQSVLPPRAMSGSVAMKPQGSVSMSWSMLPPKTTWMFMSGLPPGATLISKN